MRFDQDRLRLTGKRFRVGTPVRGWLVAITAVVLGGALLVAGLLLSMVVLVVGAAVGLVGYGVLRWKLRGWRRQLHEAAQQARAGQGGQIIDVQAREIRDRQR